MSVLLGGVWYSVGDRGLMHSVGVWCLGFANE